MVPVILFHAGYEFFSGGFVGVDVFFVISGYLITSILLDDIQKNRFSILNFYERRARRILPALYSMVVISLISSSIVLYPQELIETAKSALYVPIFSSNFYFWSERGYFGGAAELKPLIHTWSLAIEEQFYIVFPVALVVLSKYKQWLLVGVLLLVFLLSLIASYYVTLIHFDTAFFFPFTRVWELLIGVFCALLLRRRTCIATGVQADLIALGGLSLIVLSYVSFDSSILFPSVTALIPTLGTALFILASNNARFIQPIFGFKPIVFIGLTSYSLYLWHQPIFALGRSIEAFEENKVMFILVAVAFGLSSYFFIEKPFRDRSLVSNKNVVKFGILGSLCIIFMAGAIIYFEGFSKRFDDEDQALFLQLATYKGYNQKRFDELHFADFSSQNGKKIVLVGDSHAKDFLNIIDESELFKSYEFSTRQVNAGCGNLLLADYSRLNKFIPLSIRERCKLLGRYEGEKFTNIVNRADEIWLVSSWNSWVVELLPESLSNLKDTFGKPIRVVGQKNFGSIIPKTAIGLPHSSREKYSHPVVPNESEVADILDAKLENFDRYYPIMDMLCGGSRVYCSIFTDDGLLMSVDGGHLTREGAVEAAVRLRGTLIRMKN